MSYELKHPYTEEERANFIVEYNHNQGLLIEETDEAIYALEANEIMVDGKPEVNPNYEEEQAKARQKEFENKFFEIPAIDGIFQGGYYRKVPKGYQSAVESINTAFNAVAVLGLLPQDYLIFYTKPDFADETQCTEEWLVANQFKNETMTAQEFGQFYVAFMTGWNSQEHKA